MLSAPLIAILVNLAGILVALGVLWGKVSTRLDVQDEKLDSLDERSERTESLLSGLATRVEVRFATEAAGKPRRRNNRKRS
jgi:hypothetical protein